MPSARAGVCSSSCRLPKLLLSLLFSEAIKRIKSNNQLVADALFQYGPDVNLLVPAIDRNNSAAVTYLLERGADINAKNELGAPVLSQVMLKAIDDTRFIDPWRKLLSLGAEDVVSPALASDTCYRYLQKVVDSDDDEWQDYDEDKSDTAQSLLNDLRKHQRHKIDGFEVPMYYHDDIVYGFSELAVAALSGLFSQSGVIDETVMDDIILHNGRPVMDSPIILHALNAATTTKAHEDYGSATSHVDVGHDLIINVANLLIRELEMLRAYVRGADEVPFYDGPINIDAFKIDQVRNTFLKTQADRKILSEEYDKGFASGAAASAQKIAELEKELAESKNRELVLTAVATQLHATLQGSQVTEQPPATAAGNTPGLGT